MRTAVLSVAAVLFVAATGCIREPATPVEVVERPYEPIPEPTSERDVVVSSDSAEQDGAQQDAPDVAIAPAASAPPTATPAPPAATPQPAPPAAAPRFYPPDPVLFRIGAGYGALGQIDFAPCREQGLEKGYLHMRVTFRHSGRIVRASVERPAPPPDEALQCIAQQLQATMVPVFDGDDVTLSRSYFVN